MDANSLMELRLRARAFTKLKPSDVRGMSADDLKRELARAGDPKFQHVPAVLDADGLDEWIVMAFDNNGDHSDNLLETDAHTEFHGTLAECIAKGREFAADHPTMQMRVVFERTC